MLRAFLNSRPSTPFETFGVFVLILQCLEPSVQNRLIADSRPAGPTNLNAAPVRTL